jgi:hypothetical protein
MIAVVEVSNSFASSRTFSVFFAFEIAIAFAPLRQGSEIRGQGSVRPNLSPSLCPRFHAPVGRDLKSLCQNLSGVLRQVSGLIPDP